MYIYIYIYIYQVFKKFINIFIHILIIDTLIYITQYNIFDQK